MRWNFLVGVACGAIDGHEYAMAHAVCHIGECEVVTAVGTCVVRRVTWIDFLDLAIDVGTYLTGPTFIESGYPRLCRYLVI